MWVRKTQKDIEEVSENKSKINWKERLNTTIIDSLGFYILIITIITICLKTFGKYDHNPYHAIKPYTWSEINNLFYQYWYLPLLLCIPIIYEGLTGKKIIKQKKDHDLFICDKCNSKTFNAHDKCPCGGTYVNVLEMKWIDEPEKQ
jgi:amino acid permease